MSLSGSHPNAKGLTAVSYSSTQQVRDRAAWIESRLVAACGVEGVETANEGASFRTDENVPKLVMVVVTQLYEETKNHGIVCFK